jgi:hypothetical protein
LAKITLPLGKERVDIFNSLVLQSETCDESTDRSGTIFNSVGLG